MSSTLALTGFTIISSCLIYYFNLPEAPVTIYISGKPMILIKGWIFYFTLSLGIACIIVSATTLLILSMDILDAPIQFLNKIYYKISMLFRKHAPHLQAITWSTFILKLVNRYSKSTTWLVKVCCDYAIMQFIVIEPSLLFICLLSTFVKYLFK